MRTLVFVLTFSIVSCLHLNATEWINFKAKFNRTYSSHEEEISRLKIFSANLRIIEEHNAGASTFRLGVTPLADLSGAEYHRLLATADTGGRHSRRRLSASATPSPARDGRVWSGDSKDWRDEGAVTTVRNRQNSCGGGSWAFAAADTVESAWKIAGNSLVTLSEQQLLDCSASYGTSGCKGGLAEQGFEYVVQSGGLSVAADYAYYGTDGQPCRSPPLLATLTTWMYTSRGNEPELEYVVAEVGPVAARLDASQTSFQLYSSGVYSTQLCSTTDLNLAVEVVGFGTEEHYGRQVPYWLVKNAWSAGWGEYGYIKIQKDAQNMCGIATDVSFPIVG